MKLHEDKDKSTKVLGKAYRKELIVSIDRLIKKDQAFVKLSNQMTPLKLLDERYNSTRFTLLKNRSWNEAL